MSDLTGRVAVVTGAASGMGNASAVLLGERGARLVLVDVNPNVEAFAAELDAVASVGSVADSGFCDSVIAAAEELHGAVDILVNAAGTIIRAYGADTSDEDWRKIFIINFGSIWGDVGGPGHTAYAATKGAVHQITKSMALEHARDGVRVNAVLPGEIRTPMLSSARERPPTEEELS